MLTRARWLVLLTLVSAPLFVYSLADPRPSEAAGSFCDVPPFSPYAFPVEELASRGIIKGYDNGCFGVGDPTLRAQMAAFIVRAMSWGGEAHSNPFPDRGPIDQELWDDVGTLAARGVAKGYPDGTYFPTGPVLYEQVLLFISRAMVNGGAVAASARLTGTNSPGT